VFDEYDPFNLSSSAPKEAVPPAHGPLDSGWMWSDVSLGYWRFHTGTVEVSDAHGEWYNIQASLSVTLT
jgi:hypothetical protein